MMPFSEQVGRGRMNIMPMIAIDGKNHMFYKKRLEY